MKKTYKRKKRANNSMAMHEVIRNEGHIDQSNSFSITKSNYKKGSFLPFFFERDGIGRLITNSNFINDVSVCI